MIFILSLKQTDTIKKVGLPKRNKCPVLLAFKSKSIFQNIIEYNLTINMANGQPQNGAVPNGSTANTNTASAAPNNQLQPLQGQQQVHILVFSL